MFQMLCARGSQILQSKSINVEDAANELISMLCDVHEDEVDEQADEDEEGEEAEKEKEGKTCNIMFFTHLSPNAVTHFFVCSQSDWETVASPVKIFSDNELRWLLCTYVTVTAAGRRGNGFRSKE